MWSLCIWEFQEFFVIVAHYTVIKINTMHIYAGNNYTKCASLPSNGQTLSCNVEIWGIDKVTLFEWVYIKIYEKKW